MIVEHERIDAGIWQPCPRGGCADCADCRADLTRPSPPATTLAAAGARAVPAA
jgi:hypothetical protein